MDDLEGTSYIREKRIPGVTVYLGQTLKACWVHRRLVTIAGMSPSSDRILKWEDAQPPLPGPIYGNGYKDTAMVS